MVESQPHINSAPGGSPTRGVLVGRQREMGELQIALDDALSSRGRLVMLVGEPGIGKTRIAQELAGEAISRGARVLWGWCYEEAGAPPYWPWVQAIRSYVRERDPEQLRSEMGAGAADIAEIIPEVREKLPDLESPPALEPEQARFRLFDSVTRFLQNASQSQPLVLVLDDLHWADRSSLFLLEFIVRSIEAIPLLILGTYRDAEVSRRHPLSQTLGGLIREQRFLRLPLSGLSKQEVGQLIYRTTGITPLPPLVETIHGRTEGNPLFLGEVVRMLTQGGPESWQEKVTGIPEGVRDALGRHFNHLSEACNQILTTASVIGREFDFRLLSALSNDLSDELLLTLVEEALGAHAVEQVRQPTEVYRFSHALIQETLLSEVSVSRRVRLHSRIGQAIEELYSANIEAHASELAYHFAQAGPVLGTEKLVHYSLLAGEQALTTYAWEEAQAYFERALESKAGRPMDAQTADLLFGLARAQANTLARHRLHELSNTINSVFDYYVAVGDASRALTIAEYPFTRLPGSSGTTNLLSEALKLVPPDSHQEGRLLARYAAGISSGFGDYEGVLKALDQALTIAQREKDAALELDVLTTMANTQYWHLRYQESLESSLRAIELSRNSSQLPGGEANANWYAARALIPLGNVGKARTHAEAYLAMAEQYRDRFHLARALDAQGVLNYLEGNWEAAREFSDRGLAVDERDARLLYHRAILEYDVGEFGQGEAYSERLVDTMQLSPANTTPYQLVPMAVGMAAHITGTESRFGAAEEAAQAMLSMPGLLPFYAQLARTGLALLAVVHGDAVAAGEQYAVLSGWSITLTSHNLDCGHRVLGLLARTMGNLNQALSHLEDALDFCRRASYQPELAWSCHDYAEILLERDAADDRAKATALLQESMTISAELGMRPLMERVAALQERAKSQRVAAPAYPDGLTQREVEVLRLIALGRTDREIADELFISVRTVGYHVGNILNKTTSSNRAEAATYASQHGLV